MIFIKIVNPYGCGRKQSEETHVLDRAGKEGGPFRSIGAASIMFLRFADFWDGIVNQMSPPNSGLGLGSGF